MLIEEFNRKLDKIKYFIYNIYNKFDFKIRIIKLNHLHKYIQCKNK